MASIVDDDGGRRRILFRAPDGKRKTIRLGKIARRAGVGPWPRIWHSLRASCESDLAASFPLATVTKWLGNTPSVALRHYVDPTDSAFAKAAQWVPSNPGGAESGAREAQNAAQQVLAGSGKEPQSSPQDDGGQRVMPLSAAPCESLQGGKREWMEIGRAHV